MTCCPPLTRCTAEQLKAIMCCAPLLIFEQLLGTHSNVVCKFAKQTFIDQNVNYGSSYACIKYPVQESVAE